jgi:hypothetical protein
MAFFFTQLVKNFFSPWYMCTMQGLCSFAPAPNHTLASQESSFAPAYPHIYTIALAMDVVAATFLVAIRLL